MGVLAVNQQSAKGAYKVARLFITIAFVAATVLSSCAAPANPAVNNDQLIADAVKATVSARPTMTPYPTHTPIVTPTPDGCIQFTDSLIAILREWDDTELLAGQTARIALSPQVERLQTLHRRLEDVQPPECGVTLRAKTLQYMEKTIVGYLLFMDSKQESSAKAALNEAGQARREMHIMVSHLASGLTRTIENNALEVVVEAKDRNSAGGFFFSGRVRNVSGATLCDLTLWFSLMTYDDKVLDVVPAQLEEAGCLEPNAEGRFAGQSEAIGGLTQVVLNWIEAAHAGK